MTALEAHLVAALRHQLRGGRPAPAPAGGDLVWQWFCDLSAARSYHAAGPNPISYSEIEAYFYLMRWPAGPHHVAAIKAMDAAYIEHHQQPAGEQNRLPPVSERPMTPDLFDAMFG